MAYPKSMQPLVCGDRTVIPGGQARFQADVVRRGAHIDDTSQSMLQNVVWYVDGNNMGPICGAAGCSASAVELRFPASLIAGGAHTVRLEYDDYWGRHHSSTTPFRVSAVAPPFEGFEGTAIRWTASSGSLARNTARFTEGAASLQVNGSNYITLSGPDFVTSGLSHVGDQILIDVFVPTGQPNRYWLGAVQMSVTVPARAINDGYLGQVELTGLSQGAWHTLRFNVPSNVQQALRAEGLAARFKVSVNTPAGAPALLLDNLRFDGGNLTQRMGVLDPCPALDPTPIPQNTLFSFDVPGDWNVTNATGSVGTIQSRIALEVDAHGYTPIVGASFSTSELSGVSSTLLVDVMLPPAAVSASWQGAVSGFVSCPTAGINNLYIGPVSLTGLPANIFQSLTLTLPAAVVNAFRATNTCSIEIDLNVNAAGPYYFDNLRFGP
jgi:hypothetical protein